VEGTRNETAKPVRRLVLLVLMCLVLGGLGGVLTAQFKQPAPAAARFIPPASPGYDFSLRDETGKHRSLAEARGKVVVMTFVYATCRDLCPAEGNDISTALHSLPRGKVVAYMVSVDPVGDIPMRANRWLGRRSLTGGMGHFLMGTRAELAPVWRHYAIVPINASRAEALAAAKRSDEFAAMAAKQPRAFKKFSYTAPPQPSTPPPGANDPYPDAGDLAYRGRARHIAGWDFEHSAYVLLIDQKGRQRLGIPFEALSPESLERDLRVLLAGG
jgi:cytochrome oxidase Cu insertion factor (SCO1/SenC/PrrC family)